MVSLRRHFVPNPVQVNYCNRRRRKRRRPLSIHTWYDASDNLVLQYNAATDATIFKYNYGIALVSSVDGSGSEQFYLSDVLGSVSEMTDLTGMVTEGMQYDAWGNVIASYDSGSSPVGFTGQLSDTDTGLDYFGIATTTPSRGRSFLRMIILATTTCP